MNRDGRQLVVMGDKEYISIGSILRSITYETQALTTGLRRAGLDWTGSIAMCFSEAFIKLIQTVS